MFFCVCIYVMHLNPKETLIALETKLFHLIIKMFLIKFLSVLTLKSIELKLNVHSASDHPFLE